MYFLLTLVMVAPYPLPGHSRRLVMAFVPELLAHQLEVSWLDKALFFGQLTNDLVEAGLVAHRNGRVVLTQAGKLVADSVAEELL